MQIGPQVKLFGTQTLRKGFLLVFAILYQGFPYYFVRGKHAPTPGHGGPDPLCESFQFRSCGGH